MKTHHQPQQQPRATARGAPRAGRDHAGAGGRQAATSTVLIPCHPFTCTGLADIRRLVAGHAAAFGLSADRVADLVLAVDEIASNSIQHGGGRGTLRVWRDGDWLTCQIRDHGTMSAFDPDAGPPAIDQPGGRGIRLARQLCDRLHIDTTPTGTITQVQVRRGPTT